MALSTQHLNTWEDFPTNRLTRFALFAYSLKTDSTRGGCHIGENMLLTEKYRPTSPAQFVGLDKAKKLCSKLASNPFDSAWIFVGASGTGKTTISLALAEEMRAELHHIPSQGCTVAARLRAADASRLFTLGPGKTYHLVLIDEADQMTTQAQLAFLSILDSTNRPEKTIFIFTCNDSERFESRFISRCGVIEFSSYGLAKDAAALLARVWENESGGSSNGDGGSSPAPNFQRIVKEANNNIRAALMELQKELLFA